MDRRRERHRSCSDTPDDRVGQDRRYVMPEREAARARMKLSQCSQRYKSSKLPWSWGLGFLFCVLLLGLPLYQFFIGFKFKMFFTAIAALAAAACADAAVVERQATSTSSSTQVPNYFQTTPEIFAGEMIDLVMYHLEQHF